MMQTSQSKGSSSLTGQPVTMSVNDLLKMDFPIVGSKIKVAVESSVTYQNLSVEKCKTNGTSSQSSVDAIDS